MLKLKVLWPDWRAAVYDRLMDDVFPADRLDLAVAELGAPVDLKALVADADILVVKSRAVTAEVISSGRRLRLVLKYGTVVDNIDLDAADRAGIAVGVFQVPHLVAVAEHAILLMLALGKKLAQAHNAVRSGLYPLHLDPITTSEHNIRYNWMEFSGIQSLYGKTVGLIGLGEIGLATARFARAFGMRVLYFKRRRLDERHELRLGLTYSTPDDLLQRADFVSLHAPHTSETERLIGRRELGLMKPSAFVINTARGGILDQDALVEALRAGAIAGAGLDVYLQEPVPKDDPLLQLDNVILTPHIGGGNPDGPAVSLREVFRKLSRIAGGEALSDVVELVVSPPTG